MTTWTSGADLTKAEETEVRRLNGKHRDIATDGAFVLERAAVKEALQERRQATVTRLGLACFKCGGTVCEWAAGDVSARKKWVICLTCVRKPK